MHTDPTITTAEAAATTSTGGFVFHVDQQGVVSDVRALADAIIRRERWVRDQDALKERQKFARNVRRAREGAE